jgi:methyl coenzyme M reductase alpha subunit
LSNFYTVLVGYAVIAAVATPVLLYYLIKYVKLKGGFEAAFGANAAPAVPAAAAAAAANAGNVGANAGGAAAAVPVNAANQGEHCMVYALVTA